MRSRTSRPSWRWTAWRGCAARFDTVLTQALPLPATREEFLALTGWIPTVRPPPGGGRPRPPPLAGPDPRTSGLAEALTAPAMAPRLQSMLADDWELLVCSPRQAVRGTRGGRDAAVPAGAPTPRCWCDRGAPRRGRLLPHEEAPRSG